MLSEAQKQFKWTQDQADDAIRPLLGRMGQTAPTTISATPRKTKRK
jgi:hypothetical protein